MTALALLCSPLTCLGKEQIFIPKKSSPESRKNEFQATEDNCKNLVPRENLAGKQLDLPSYERGLCVINEKLAFHCKSPLEFVFFH